uniref:Uncharacterized protein n=1 Tax=Callorhinchus milii TaxID=7868 RepID=A0A4W3JEY4_CALMI
MGTRALSHDSIFIPDGSTADGTSAQAISQENISGKIQSLQVRDFVILTWFITRQRCSKYNAGSGRHVPCRLHGM